MLRRMLDAILNADTFDDKVSLKAGTCSLQIFQLYDGEPHVKDCWHSFFPEDYFRWHIYSHIVLNISQDYVGNKRLELSGQLISLLFEVFIFSYLVVRCYVI